jgi:shikimate kinase
MKLVFLYGPPAAGKLTIARALEKETGLALFDNHQANNMVARFFPFATPPFFRASNRVRLLMLEEALKENIPGVIMTFAYVQGVDDPFLEEMKELLERYGGELISVRLLCSREELRKRVATEERKAYQKLADPDQLIEVLDTWQFEEPITLFSRTDVDTTEGGVEGALAQILPLLNK